MDCCPARFPDCYSHSPTFLDLFLCFNLVFFSAVAFRPLGNLDCYCLSFHRLSVKPKSGCPFLLHSLWLFSCWLGRSLWSSEKFPSEVIFKLGASTAAAEFCEWVQVVIDVHISHRKYYVKPYSSPWLSAALVEITSFVCTLLRYSSGTILQIVVAGNESYFLDYTPINASPTKWSNTLKQCVDNLLTNCLSVFDHFVGLALKGIWSTSQDKKLWYYGWRNTVVNPIRQGC